MNEFKRTVWAHYRAHKRDMPWRRDTSLYAVVVSEIMLQQTQVPRVMVKYASWMKKFPTWVALAKAPVKEVLAEWSGLGYNRRALYLKRIAGVLRVSGHPDRHALPLKVVASLREQLLQLPGIGPNTAGAILAYAYNIPYPFIETNIRSVYIHSFFPNKKKVTDKQLMPLIIETLADKKIAANPREWHWALMDYGSHLKSIAPNPSRRSAHHAKQTPFKGSNRELRSQILKAVMNGEKMPPEQPDGRVRANLGALVREGFLVRTGSASRPTYRVA